MAAHAPRARLVLSLGVMLVLALRRAGALIVRTTRSNLDRPDRHPARDDGRPRPRAAGRAARARVTGAVAVVFFDDEGTVLGSFQSGFARDPDPAARRCPAGGTIAWRTLYGKVVDGQSADGSVHYRMLLAPVSARGFEFNVVDGRAHDGRRRVRRRARPESAARRWARGRSRSSRPAGSSSGAICGRSTGSPRTADRSPAATCRRRADVPHDRTEVGRLSTAFDAMLDRIQASFDSQQAALEAKARREDRLRRFVGDASHELRTPLTALRGYVDLYRAGGLADDAALDQAMRRIGTESRRMASLVEDLLLLARLDQGRPLAHEPRGPEPARRRRRRRRAGGGARRGRSRPIDGPGSIVIGDEDRLRQVVGNLFANVRVHTPPTTPARGPPAAHDDGPRRAAGRRPRAGHRREHADQVFDRFYRADPGALAGPRRSGLGLSIVASVVDALRRPVWHAHAGRRCDVRRPESRSQQLHSPIPGRISHTTHRLTDHPGGRRGRATVTETHVKLNRTTVVLPLAGLLVIGGAGAVLRRERRRAVDHQHRRPGRRLAVAQRRDDRSAPDKPKDTVLEDVLDEARRRRHDHREPEDRPSSTASPRSGAARARRPEEAEAQATSSRSFLADGVITQEEIDQLPADSYLR